MNARPRFAGRSDMLLLWLASLVALCAGYYLAFDFIGTAIDDQHRLTAAVRTTVSANAQRLAQGPVLARQASSVADQLRLLRYRADGPTCVAHFIAVLTRIAAARSVSIARIDGHESAAVDAAQPALGAAEGPDNAPPTELIPLDVTLRGSYRALLATIRDLAQAPLIVQIDIATIEHDSTAARTDGEPPLIARMHVVLEHATDQVDRPAPLPSLPPLPSEEPTTHAPRPF